MADLAFTPQHNMVAYLEKTECNAKFHQIADFRTSSFIHHALTVNHTIYASNIEQFWNTANSQIINDEKQIHAIVDGKTVVITESLVRIDLLFTNDNGITYLTNAPDISAARPKVSTAEPKTPSTTTTLFDDEDVTIVDTLVKMKNQKAKEKGVVIKDADDSARPIRSITTLQPLLTIDLKDKDLDEKVRTERERQEEASKAALAKLYDKVQAQIDADYELAARFTHKEQEKYTVEERSKLLVEFFEKRKKWLAKERAKAIRSKPPIKTQLRNLMMTYPKHTGRFTHAQLKSKSFEEIQKLYTKEHKLVGAFVPIGSKEDEKRVGSRKKRASSSSSKQKSPKKQKVNDQESIGSDKELKKCLKVLGTMEAGDVHVYKLTRLDGSYIHFSTFFRMLILNRQDVLDLHKIVMKRFLANDPEGYDLILWGDLKTLVKSSKDGEI
uniref:Uncharacterized protein n=1 Tax=Tanacetum cinerariifolium TaxID=118510 RepID=A0A699ILF4_TANCI|nr:hypothetical protein [Tanacetum cinerariifolium]